MGVSAASRARREPLAGSYVWAGEAASLVEGANPTTQDSLDENPDRELPQIVWDSFLDRE